MDNENLITPGKTATASVKVTEINTAKVVGSGSLDVFATPMMIALMEQAACNALLNILEDGQTSVGTNISVEHINPSPVDANITATAEIMSVNGRKIEFKVSAADDSGEIGKGVHTRFIVDGLKLADKAQNRLK